MKIPRLEFVLFVLLEAEIKVRVVNSRKTRMMFWLWMVNAFLTIRFHSRRLLLFVFREQEGSWPRIVNEKQTRGNDKSSNCSKMLSKKDEFVSRFSIFFRHVVVSSWPDAHRRSCIDIYNSIAKKGTAETTS